MNDKKRRVLLIIMVVILIVAMVLPTIAYVASYVLASAA